MDGTLGEHLSRKKTFFPSSVKAQKRFGLLGAEFFQEDNGLAVFTVNVNVITVRVVKLISSLLGWYVTGVDVKTAFLHATLDGQEDIYVRPPLLLSRWGFTEKGTLWRLKKALCGLRSAPRLWGLKRDAVLTALVMCREGKDYILKQSCADLALWIVVCLGVETSLLLRDDQGHAIGSVVGYVLTHVDDMLTAGDIPVLHLFTIALKKSGKISQSNIIGLGREGEITYTGMWIAALSGGGFGIQQ